ncbi:beta-lactamase/transpeptidase-like protein [Gamsiella multidivaricata]|uniref:beta-lactamase/transpeptidase-like protein n=1 Tax=Gamsiella multidivaricata TaxID=101098 RepID=UPI0022210EAB|nr:beta-lactamase/transpeptidase-like protein [Gamsiella multidivaricata]KAG0364702.1 hypothetical protein BGZ54_007259 [Gamsiella multidivaricata]KAI7816853.1 beta-lactamase/transpeptidase-like protein [Gamsiella multidivaricata]
MTASKQTQARGGTTSPPSSFSLPRLSPFQWFLHLLPAIIFAFYVYSTKGPFQSVACLTFNRSCNNLSNFHLEGILDRSEFYAPVISYYTRLFATHEDLGGSFAVFVEGEPVIDLFAGTKDLEGTIPYANQTLQQVYSSGKVVEGIVIARLVQKGLLDYSKRVADYWPEFAQNGKQDVRLVDVMVHESGVFHVDDPGRNFTWETLADREEFSEKLAKQKHYFGGQVARAYHAVSRGWYLNEIVRRVDPQGRTIGQIAREELMGDYTDVELHYSLFENDRDWEDRLAPMFDYPVLRIIGRLLLPRSVQTNKWIGYPDLPPLHPLVWQLIQKWSLSSKALTPRMAPFASSFRTKKAHTTESTSFSLKTNAHSLAKLVSMMANKGASIHPGQEPDLISPETYAEATSYHSTRPCAITFESLPLSRGGWVKSRNFFRDGPLTGVEVQGWGGAGGSLVVWIEELGIGFSYVTNAFGAPMSILGDFRGKTLLEKVVVARKKELGLLPADNKA